MTPTNGIFILFIFLMAIIGQQMIQKFVLDLLDQDLLPASNVFCYGQVESRYGSGQFYKDLVTKYGEDDEKVILSKIKNKDGILDSIKDFLGKGK